MLRDEWGEWTRGHPNNELLWKTSSKKHFVVVKTERAPRMENQNPMEDGDGLSEATADRILRKQKREKARQERHLHKDIPRFQPVVDQTPARKERKKLVKEEKENLKSMRDLSLETYEESKGPMEEELGKSEVATGHSEESAEDVSDKEMTLQTSPLHE